MASSPRVQEYHEGPEAARRFDDATARLLRVSKTELIKREAAYQKSRRRSKKHSR